MPCNTGSHNYIKVLRKAKEKCITRYSSTSVCMIENPAAVVLCLFTKITSLLKCSLIFLTLICAVNNINIGLAKFKCTRIWSGNCCSGWSMHGNRIWYHSAILDQGWFSASLNRDLSSIDSCRMRHCHDERKSPLISTWLSYDWTESHALLLASRSVAGRKICLDDAVTIFAETHMNMVLFLFCKLPWRQQIHFLNSQQDSCVLTCMFLVSYIQACTFSQNFQIANPIPSV